MYEYVRMYVCMYMHAGPRSSAWQLARMYVEALVLGEVCTAAKGCTDVSQRAVPPVCSAVTGCGNCLPISHPTCRPGLRPATAAA